MLTRLRISNFALLEEIDIEFGEGLTFFTGETGAGKSILIDAICRLMGARAAQDDVRAGAQRAVLEAIFDTRHLPERVGQLLSRWNIEPEEGEWIVRREIQANGKSRAAVNNCSLTIAQLKEISPGLIDVFGQNEHQSLLDQESQQQLYDQAAGTRDKLAGLAGIASGIAALQQEWKRLTEREQQRQRDIDLLQYQIKEIEDAGVSESEEQELASKRLILQNSERIKLICDSLLNDILESDQNLIGRIEQVGKRLEELRKYREQFVEYTTRLVEWLDQLNDMARQVDSLEHSLEFEDGSLDVIETRLDQLQKLKKKYGPALADVFEHLGRCKKELNEIFRAEWRTEEIVQAIRKEAARYEQLAAEISEARLAAKEAFERKLEAELKHVAMEKCRFRVVMTKDPGCGDDPEKLMAAAFPARGRESVAFEIEPNPGEGFRELSHIASGGELARLMLALKVVGQSETGRSFIFDEIDAGIGGRAAYQIGERLKKLSRQAQVLCVTHLPQVAAFARHHFRVAKKVRAGRTTTSVEAVEGEERIHELARMLSGSDITETALQHARELCEQVEGSR